MTLENRKAIWLKNIAKIQQISEKTGMLARSSRKNE